MKIYLITLLMLTPINIQAELPRSPLSDNVQKNVWPKLQSEMKVMGFKSRNPIFLRIFKEEHVLEIWVQRDKKFKFFKSYPICFFSGGLGTKIREGDGKSPEGFYTITAGQLNPVSNYHLAINVGYPNKVEQANKYTGNSIMIHGHCASIGCYAMTDPEIDEIYTMVYQSLAAGQKSISLHILPFKMDKVHMQVHTTSSVIDFWRNLKQGYDLFEKNHVPPVVYATGKRYGFKTV